MKGSTWIALIAIAGGGAYALSQAKKKKDAAQAAALAAKATGPILGGVQEIPKPKPKPTKKKTAGPVTAADLPSPAYSFQGSVVGNCIYNGGPGVVVEYDDGTTECLSSYDPTSPS